MFRAMLKSKLHRACVTHSELNYVGSCAIDRELMDSVDIIPNEQLHIFNITNGERFVTYAIEAEPKSRIISINGAAAHKANPGDRIIICTFSSLSSEELSSHVIQELVLDENNYVINKCDKELQDKIRA